ncbi:MAG: hypothetical protein JW870_01915 [Candidatus Delongbacteria bacterium]|nr:hypothetical protein [Candidatus Delongbacteria bacterium]
MDKLSKIEIWEKHIANYRNSKLTAKKWCSKNKISYSNLKYWITRTNKISNISKQNEETQEWISIDTDKEDSPIESPPIKINVGSFCINIPDDFNVKTLAKIIKTFGDENV